MTYEIGTEHSLKVLLELKSKSFMTLILIFFRMLTLGMQCQCQHMLIRKSWGGEI